MLDTQYYFEIIVCLEENAFYNSKPNFTSYNSSLKTVSKLTSKQVGPLTVHLLFVVNDRARLMLPPLRSVLEDRRVGILDDARLFLFTSTSVLED